VTISREEVESIARAAGIAAATETLRLIGVDPERPFEMQADFAHLRRWRLVVERSVLASVLVLVTAVAGGFAAYVGFGKH
jgi:hypothetical protein